MTDRIDFTPTPADLAAAARDLRPRNWGRWDRARLVFAGVFVVLAVFVAMAQYAWRQHGVWLMNWEDMAAFAFAGAVLGWGYGRIRDRYPDGDPRLGSRSFVLGPEGFETRGRDFETRIGWPGIAEIAARRDTLFFVTGWKEYFFVPRRAFADATAAAAFEKKARAYWTARRARAVAEAVEARKIPHRYDLAYRLQRSDIAAFAGLRREITGWRKALLFLPPFVLGGAAAWFREVDPAVAAWLDDAGPFELVILVVVGAGLWYALVTLVMTVARAVAVRRARLPDGETRLTADRTSVRVAADGVAEHYTWHEIPAVTLGAGHVFLATAPRKAVIVPLRAFQGREAMIKFYQFAEEASKNADP